MTPKHDRHVELIDSTGCMVGNAAKIAARYDRANAGLKRGGAQAAHLERLKSALFSIIAGGEHPYALADVAQQAISQGLPVDPHALFAPEHVLATEARFLALAIPSLSNLHRDCKLWLAEKLKRPVDRIEPSIAWNLALGGATVNARGD